MCDHARFRTPLQKSLVTGLSSTAFQFLCMAIAIGTMRWSNLSNKVYLEDLPKKTKVMLYQPQVYLRVSVVRQSISFIKVSGAQLCTVKGLKEGKIPGILANFVLLLKVLSLKLILQSLSTILNLYVLLYTCPLVIHGIIMIVLECVLQPELQYINLKNNGIYWPGLMSAVC